MKPLLRGNRENGPWIMVHNGPLLMGLPLILVWSLSKAWITHSLLWAMIRMDNSQIINDQKVRNYAFNASYHPYLENTIFIPSIIFNTDVQYRCTIQMYKKDRITALSILSELHRLVDLLFVFSGVFWDSVSSNFSIFGNFSFCYGF